MNNPKQKTKQELIEQNELLKSMLKSFDDIKKGRLSDFEFSE